MEIPASDLEESKELLSLHNDLVEWKKHYEEKKKKNKQLLGPFLFFFFCLTLSIMVINYNYHYEETDFRRQTSLRMEHIQESFFKSQREIIMLLEILIKQEVSKLILVKEDGIMHCPLVDSERKPEAIIPPLMEPLKVTVIIGPKGSGKREYAFLLANTSGLNFMELTDWSEDGLKLKGKELVIFSKERMGLTYDQLIGLLSYQPSIPVATKHGIWWEPTEVIITSEYPVHEWYSYFPGELEVLKSKITKVLYSDYTDSYQ